MAENTFVAVETRWSLDINPLNDEEQILTQKTRLSNGYTEKLYYNATTIPAATSISTIHVEAAISAAETWANT